MGAKLSNTNPNRQANRFISHASSTPSVTSDASSSGSQYGRARIRQSNSNGSDSQPLAVPSGALPTDDLDLNLGISPGRGRRRRRRDRHGDAIPETHSLPSHLFPTFLSDVKCPVCNKLINSDDIELHLVQCLTKPRISYNEDRLTADAGECFICLEDMCQGDRIARLPCLCIYHKKCIDDWFRIKRCCPEHPEELPFAPNPIPEVTELSLVDSHDS